MPLKLFGFHLNVALVLKVMTSADDVKAMNVVFVSYFRDPKEAVKGVEEK